jgi:Asp-tRNA(Asn)/Glu-tRNA(Gln) amidotransferase A subunit family amidase
LTAADALRDLSVSALTAAVAARELDPVEAVECHLAAIDGAAHLNAVISTCPESALDRARAGVDGPLAGAPLLVKDIFDTAGVRTTYGSSIFRTNVPDHSAAAVVRAELAGAIVIGKANLHEFAWGTTSQNPHYGAVGNPATPGRIAGGSSGGNAAALAARLSSLGLGTDTGGSARGPSACCRVVGFKPILGTIPTGGCFPLSATFDTVAPMARSVADCTLLYSVLSGLPLPEPHLRGLVVGVVTRAPRVVPGEPVQELPPAGRTRLARHAARLEDLGARLVEVELPEPTADVVAVVQAEAARSHAGLYPERRDDYGEDTRAKLDAARRVTPAAERDGRRAIEDWRRRAAAEPAVDLILCSVLGGEVPEAGAREQDVRDGLLAFTRPLNFLDWAAIAIGDFQLAGRQESVVLGAALAWEEANGSPDTAGAWPSIAGDGPE